MDTDGLPSAPIFAAFLVLFFYLSLAQNLAGTTGGAFISGTPNHWPAFLLRWLRNASIIAMTVSGLALVSSSGGFNWWSVSLLSFGFLLGLVGIDRATASLASQYPARIRRLCRPLSRLLRGVAERGGAVTGNGADRKDSEDHQREDSPDFEHPVITEAELVSLDQRDREMLRSILRLDVTTAREIMMPRLDMIAIESDSSLLEVAEKMIQGGHSRIPVYEESIDHILGIVHYREILQALSQPKPDQRLKELLNPAFFIPETKRLDDLLEELQDKGIQMAIVVDEYGGTEGLVTMEDLLEEIVGEIEDEFSRTREPVLVHLPDGGVLVDAGIPTGDIEELFSTTIDSSDVDTVGGYVYLTLGKIPEPGNVVDTDDLRIEVVSIMGRRLRKLRIHRKEAGSSAPTG